MRLPGAKNTKELASVFNLDFKHEKQPQARIAESYSIIHNMLETTAL